MLFGGNNLKFRQEWVRKTLNEIPSNKKLIDVGAGECQYKKYCDHLKYTSQDFNQYTGEGNGAGLQTGKWDISQIDIISDITTIPVPNNSFDVVLCTEVLEHVPNPVAAIEEMTRILNEQGTLIITAPFCSLTHFAPFHYCDGFNKYFYQFHLERLGFENIEITPNGNYFEYMAQEMHRLPFIVSEFSKRNTFFVKVISRLMTMIYKFYEARSINKDSLLCFGFHVKAVKK